MINDIDAKQLLNLVDKKNGQLLDQNTVIIDIRSPSEHRGEHIKDSINVPFTQFEQYDWTQHKNNTLIFYCARGNRTKQAIDKLNMIPCKAQYCLAEGITQWKNLGLPTIIDRHAPIDLMRQVQIIAGILVILGVILSYLWSIYFIYLSLFVGMGLLFAGVTGFCGMAKLLMCLPYNRR